MLAAANQQGAIRFWDASHGYELWASDAYQMHRSNTYLADAARLEDLGRWRESASVLAKATETAPDNGSRSGLQKLSEREISLAGFKKSIRGAVNLHEKYNKDKEQVGQQLSGKLPTSKSSWQTPEQIPTLKQNARLNRG